MLTYVDVQLKDKKQVKSRLKLIHVGRNNIYNNMHALDCKQIVQFFFTYELQFHLTKLLLINELELCFCMMCHYNVVAKIQ
ncbi:hypothetical protein PUN28_017161 [Cardiocondyla obscurior]|uniref:Uncharacterized protein n=1 Tax=Cardiocondyla obscurior TaxID=286306 RepID=A0AAW2EKI7_9HYME